MTETQPFYKQSWFLFLTVFIINLCFRLIYISHHSFWFDECIWVDIGEWDTKKIIEFCRTQDPNPPLYPLFLHYWIQLFGDSEFSVRFITALAISLGGGFLFLLADKFFNRQTAIFSSLMFFTSNELFYYAQEARPYALIILFVILSNYVFLQLINKPSFVNSILLGVFNCILFYLHILSAFCFIGQAILFPILIQKTRTFNYIEGTLKFNYHFKLKPVLYYLASWLTFYAVFYPWQTRFINLIQTGSKNFWLPKPSFKDFKLCIYDFFNSKELYQVHVFSLIFFILILIFFKRYRENNISLTSLIIAIVIGPVLIYLNYRIASFSPIFLKRYVLFTIIGFMLIYAYVFSLIRLPLIIKFFAFLVLSFFSFMSIKLPREAVFDYKNGVAFLKKNQTPHTLIINDNPELFSYYYREGAWEIKPYNERVNYLISKNILAPMDNNWPKTMDFSKYSDVYYTKSFEGYSDPKLEVETYLKNHLSYVENINDYVGIKIVHFKNPNFQLKK